MEEDSDIVDELVDAEYTVVASLDGEASEIVSNKYQGAFVLYRELYDEEALDVQHVYVPKEHRGHGVAEGLVKEALSLAKKKGWKIIPTCTYVRDTFFARNPMLRDEFCKTTSR